MAMRKEEWWYSLGSQVGAAREVSLDHGESSTEGPVRRIACKRVSL